MRLRDVKGRLPRVVVVSNRLPVRRVVDEDGAIDWDLSPGGLVSALGPILRRRNGTWIGWAGDDAAESPSPFVYDGMHLHPVPISRDEIRSYYDGFCNRTLWPLYHDCIRLPVYRQSWWEPFVEINRRFATAALDVASAGDVIWVHDYQLQLVPELFRRRAPQAKIGFFLHIPFPPLELLAQLPWRRQLVHGLLGADVIGFQTTDGARNFVRAAERMTTARRDESGTLLMYRDRPIRTAAFPISIDTARFEEIAAAAETRSSAASIRDDLGGRTLLLGVDRLDYSKGVAHRLRAFESLLSRSPGLADELVLVQIAVPTRESVPDYAQLRRDLEQLAGRINGRFGRPGRVPVHFLCRSLPPAELVAYYVAADVMAVTPLRDGMNLVAKEFVATRLDGTGTLVLSEFAGSSHVLSEALLVNPHDHEALVDALRRATTLPVDEARRRMRCLREEVARNDVYSWADSFLGTLTASAPAVFSARPARDPMQDELEARSDGA